MANELSQLQRVAFGKRLKLLLKENGMTQEQFHNEFGATKRTIWHWSTGRVNPHESSTRMIADFFHVNHEWLRYGRGKR